MDEEMSAEMVGREEELSSLYAVLDRTADGPAALVVEGEAGIGKSTLWRAGVDAARARGRLVLFAEPAEVEQGLAHAGLGDLFENVLESVLPALSAPRRRALEVALLLEDGADGSDPRTLGVAVRSALDFLTAQTPLVLAVDDLQWLDPSSASALAFAVRRMREQPILVLLARRLGEGAEPSELERAIEGDRLERLSIGPLSLGATHRLVRARLGRTFSRPTLLRVHEVSGGNPFYALELARVLSADVDPMEPLHIPATLEGLVRARLDGLPPGTRQGLLLASALGRPSVALIADLGVTQDVLEPAFAAHVIERANGTIRFTHPLLASVVYQGVSADERRRAHGLVAQIVDDPILRARHLALSTERPDTEIAAALEDATALASTRGALITAAELGEHALRLTPSEARDDLHRRAVAATRAHLQAGEGTRARTIAVDLVARTRAGPSRAEALLLLSELENLDRTIDLLHEALTEAAASPALRALIHRRLADHGRMTKGREWAQEHARASLELAESLDDDALRAGALSVLAGLRFEMGDPEAPRLAERAYEAAALVADEELLKDADMELAHMLMWSAETGRARTMLESQHREWNERDELRSADALWCLSWVELRAGRWSLAAEYAQRSREVGAQYEIEWPPHFFLIALVAAHRGELERARAAAERGGALADRQGALLAGLVAVPGLVDFWSGDAPAAAASFAAAEQTADARGWREPNMRWWRAEYVEALLELGRMDKALDVLDVWEADAARVGRKWVLAQVARCRGLLAAAKADVEQAQSLLEEAVAKHEAVGDPFGRARALLALGLVRRRARQKRAARQAIEAALAEFAELGAVSWAARARAELGRIGGRTRIEGLTPAERRVADLVAGGQTNREVAATLFLGERTVASHLTHIYAKLGVRSRTELARRLQ
jgi:DNA-binding CsgD family transcriptional regulator